MGRELQKKKNRSSIRKQTRRRNPRIHKVTIKHPIIKANWDKSLTILQNYKRLGLIGKLNKPTGGTEKSLAEAASALKDPSESNKNQASKNHNNRKQALDLAPNEARIERDLETGAILRVVYGKSGDERLDELSDLENNDRREQGGEEEDDRCSNPIAASVLKQLQDVCARGVSASSMRTQSQREKEWIDSLVRKHGEDYKAMMRDRKLNPYQQSEGDIKKRIKIWREKGGKI